MGDSKTASVLFLAYYFPPLGGAGSQRTLKFVKYLPKHGFKPSLIGGQLAEQDRWAPPDDTMCSEVGDSVRIERVDLYRKPFSSSKVRNLREILNLPSEFGTRWRDGALEAGRRLCEESRPDLLFATMSPFESAEVAEELGREFGIPWVADLRDPWALDEWQILPSRWHRQLRIREMGRRLSSASLVIMNTPEAAKRFRKHFAGHRSEVISLTNGFDAEDFLSEDRRPEPNRFEIVHAGALHTSSGLRQRQKRAIYDLLGRNVKSVTLLTRSHLYLVQALERWFKDAPEVRENVRLELIGIPTEDDKRIVEGSSVADVVSFLGYLSHEESLMKVRGAGMLFLPMYNLAEGERAGIVPGKTYEYLASGRPILGAVPDGDCRDFLKASEIAEICRPDDVAGMVEGLKKAYARWEKKAPLPVVQPEFLEQFERSNLTARLANELHKVLGSTFEQSGSCRSNDGSVKRSCSGQQAGALKETPIKGTL